ncbi:MAG: DNA polymerase III subunit alpha, partial [Bacteroidales bacterium]|nr:DNA polymerase III subunit alpha [Bacteroidales bacterium]
MYIIFDTETTGLPKDWNAPISDSNNWPRMVQLAWQMHDIKGDLMEVKNFIVKPEDYTIPFNATKIHGISTERANQQGVDLSFVLDEFNKDLERAQFVVGHNIKFDVNIVGAELYRKQIESKLALAPSIDTMSESVNYCAIPSGNRFKFPNLTELHQKLFNEGFAEAHNASADVEATTRCFLELIRIGVLTAKRLNISEADLKAFRENNPRPIELLGLNIEPYKSLSAEGEENSVQIDSSGTKKQTAVSSDHIKAPFSHLHNHSSYSILGATTEITALIKAAVDGGMPAVGLCDHGNMYAGYFFTDQISKANKEIKAHNEKIDSGELNGSKKTEIKGILGCEVYVAEHYKQLKFTKDSPDRRFNQVLFAKDRPAYHNLSKLVSQGFIEGSYAGYPRVGKELIEEFHEGLIAFTGGPTGEIPNLILNVGEEQAEEAFQWWHNLFGKDFYVELIRHGLPEDDHVNEVLLRFAKKYGVKVIAQNNTYYLEQKDSHSHDILLCVRDGEKKDTPIGRGRGFRYGFPNNEFYFKSQQEMKKLFADIPEAIENITEIVNQIENYHLARPVLLPAFDIPEEFIVDEDAADGGKRGENKYLRHLTYEGAKKRYGEITDSISERLDFELATIERTGYPGYFLIVQDFTSVARKMGVSVGPGRGSAAGSAVAYCVGITNVDPIKYDLLFERFLNPDRVSLPDIDIDFDDEGRGRIIDWVVQKYGKNQVAQIITYGTMAAKSSIRDTARVLDLPLSEADRIAKLVPDTKLKKLFKMDEKTMKEKLNPDQIQMANQLISISKGSDLAATTLNQAHSLEGSVRNTGIHACGVIITPDDIRKYVPVAISKDSDLLVTQFDNSVVETAGLLKMDFLGLKTLTLIKDAVRNVKKRHGIEIIPDDIPLDDEKTYELFQRGETVGIFQYESPGMQKHLKDLKPTVFADLIAMNALYRPGPLEYIPSFIRRKHGTETITYDIEAASEYLEETYGITVYQEQVMLLSQSLANFTKGEADTLRKAMGKKKFDLLAKLKPKFLEQGASNGHDKKMLEKMWTDWEAFASYAFNKSHSTCYAWIAYQTAYFKAHYPAEYMASVLSNNMSDIKQVTFFIEECKRMGVQVLGPDINESHVKFTVNKEGAIRFGMAAIKGVGEAAVEEIIRIREEDGDYSGPVDMVKRVNLRTVNKKAIEALAYSGGFDFYKLAHRAQYFHKVPGENNYFLEK